MSLAWFLPLPGSYAGVDVVGVYNFACSLREVLAKHPFLPHGCGLFSGSYFPSFSEGLSLRAAPSASGSGKSPNFPSFSEGLSLRDKIHQDKGFKSKEFPFLFGGTFIEGWGLGGGYDLAGHNFPSFSEGLSLRVFLPPCSAVSSLDFPSFSEGLSLRETV